VPWKSLPTLHLEHRGELGLNVSAYAESTAGALALIHWEALVDAEMKVVLAPFPILKHICHVRVGAFE
jgi:hypothetical protein